MVTEREGGGGGALVPLPPPPPLPSSAPKPRRRLGLRPLATTTNPSFRRGPASINTSLVSTLPEERQPQIKRGSRSFWIVVVSAAAKLRVCLRAARAPRCFPSAARASQRDVPGSTRWAIAADAFCHSRARPFLLSPPRPPPQVPPPPPTTARARTTRRRRREENKEAMTSIHPQTCSEPGGPSAPSIADTLNIMHHSDPSSLSLLFAIFFGSSSQRCER